MRHWGLLGHHKSNSSPLPFSLPRRKIVSKCNTDSKLNWDLSKDQRHGRYRARTQPNYSVNLLRKPKNRNPCLEILFISFAFFEENGKISRSKESWILFFYFLWFQLLSLQFACRGRTNWHKWNNDTKDWKTWTNNFFDVLNVRVLKCHLSICNFFLCEHRPMYVL